MSRKDLLVIGGGISGAAVALAAARRGLSVLLVERHDYASGASSNSSKLVHGGLRYLKQGAWGLMRESLQAREQLLRDAPGLVRPMPFLMPHRPGGSPGRLAMRAGLFVYDQLACRRTRRFLSAAQVQAEVPGLAAEWGASGYEDASTDDARHTQRLLQFLEKAGQKCLDLLRAFYYQKTPVKQLAETLGYANEHSASVQKYKCLEKVRHSIQQKSLRYEDFHE